MSSKPTASELISRAHVAHGAGDLESAARIYSESAARGDATKDDTLAALNGLRATARRLAAITVAENALRKWPDSPMFLVHAADTYLEAGDLDGAIRCLEQITEFCPDKSRYWVRLAHVYSIAERWADAESAFATALSISPMDLVALSGRG
ncbi:MAG: tetratricopeptide repeat protein, partial [Rhodospirillaceae bacterium]